MKSEHLFIIRLGDGRHFEYEGTLDGAKRKASKLATPPVAIQLLAEQRLVATRRPYFGWDGKVWWHPWELLERAFSAGPRSGATCASILLICSGISEKEG